MKRENKGITLVALVITIIVLIILAGVSINAVMNGGLITNAKDAKNEYEKGKTEENKALSQLEISKVQMDFYSKGIPYSLKNGFLTGINIIGGKAETVGDFRKKLPEKYGYKICDLEGGEITDEATIVCPGMVIKKDGEPIGKVVIYGDIVGSIGGEIDILDGGSASRFINSVEELKDYRIVGMDVNHDNIVNYIDVDLIGKAALGNYSIEQNVEASSLSLLVIDDKKRAEQEWKSTLQSKIQGSQYSIETENDYFLFKGIVAGTKVEDLIESDNKKGFLPINTEIRRNSVKLEPTEEVKLNDTIHYTWGDGTYNVFWGYIDF